jgi:Secretion system C-terminal sorting domain
VHAATAGYANGGFYFNNGKPFFYETYDLWFRTYVTIRTLGVNNFDISSSLKIYPNPATNQVKIDLQKLDNANVEVLDSNGKKMFIQKLNTVSNTIKIDHLASGTYFFKVNSNQGSVISKVIKN